MSAPAAAAPRGHRALLVALGVDDLGAGLVLPLVLVYLTAVVGLPLALAGPVLTAGTLVGLAAPPLAGAAVDRHGPARVVVASTALQALGIAAYLLARGPLTALVAAALVAAGTQTFYSALVALVADVAPPGPRDHAFAGVEAVRSAAFGVGALVAGLLVVTVDAGVLRAALAVDAATSVVAGAVVAALVRPAPRSRADAAPQAGPTAVRAPRSAVWRDRPYLALIGAAALLGLPVDVLLVGLAVYLAQLQPGAAWAGGASIALLTAASALLTRAVVRRTAGWSRPAAMAVGGVLSSVWAVLVAGAVLLPAAWVGPWVLGAAAVAAAGGLVSSTRATALAEAAAPAASRGRHLAAYQYAYTAAGLAAPLVAASAAFALWLPWALVAAAALAGAAAVRAVGRHLPRAALR